MAKAELAQLEHRFRMRIQHGQSSMPLPPQAIPMNATQSALRFAPAAGQPASAAVATSWLQTLASQMGAQAPGTAQFVQAQSLNPQYQVGAQAPWSFITAAPQQAGP